MLHPGDLKVPKQPSMRKINSFLKEELLFSRFSIRDVVSLLRKHDLQNMVKIVLPLTYLGKGTITECLLNSTFAFLSGFLIWLYTQDKERTRESIYWREHKTVEHIKAVFKNWMHQQYVSLLQTQLEIPDMLFNLLMRCKPRQIFILFWFFLFFCFRFRFLFVWLF